MLHQLDKTQFEKARYLFGQLEQAQPMCAAVLEGVYPGKVFADNADRPRTALLTTFLSSEAESVWGFLAGDPANDGFNQTLNTALFKRQIINENAPVVFLTCEPQNWGGQMPVVMSPRPPIVMSRHRYVCRQTRYDWQAALPKLFAVQRLSQDLLRRPGLDVPDEVSMTIKKWRAAAHERFQDFGFVAIDETEKNPVVAGWATVDFVVNGAGDIGLFTQPAYRRRGLAAITAAAALEYGLAHGLSLVNWTCSADNPGSIRTAAKLGLERADDYSMCLLMFDEARHTGALAYYALVSGKYEQAADAYDQAFALSQDQPDFICYEAARAWATLGNTQKALAYLYQAAARGWSDVADAQARQEFEKLRHLPEWDAITRHVMASEMKKARRT